MGIIALSNKYRYNFLKGAVMNKDILEGKWKQLSGEIRKKWGELTDDDLDQAMGQKDILIGKLQERYGYTREKAKAELDTWLKKNKVDYFS
jgi:uncharacterized protein YjbJ (UPF0337 family)